MSGMPGTARLAGEQREHSIVSTVRWANLRVPTNLIWHAPRGVEEDAAAASASSRGTSPGPNHHWREGGESGWAHRERARCLGGSWSVEDVGKEVEKRQEKTL